MSDWAASLGGRRRAAELVGWGLAGLAVLVVHAAGGYFLLRAAPAPMEAGAEEVIFDIALEAAAPPEPQPEPQAQDAPPMEAAPEPEETPENLPDAPEDVPRPEPIEPQDLAEALPDALPQIDSPPEPRPEPEPEPLPEPVVEPDLAEDLPVNDLAEAILAPAASVKPPPRPERKAASRKPAAPRTVAPPKAEAPKVAEVAQAPAVTRGVSPEKAEADWRSSVNARVAKHMARWDNRSRAQVSLAVVISVDGAGRVTGVSVEGGTGDAKSDASIRAHAAKLSGLPKTPDGKSRNLRVPITLRR